MNAAQIISGIVLAFGGLILLVLSLVNGFKNGWLVALFYGIPCLAIGLAILFNKSEDKIEEIRKK